MPDGSVLARIQTFHLKADADTTITLVLPSVNGINRKAGKDSHIELFLAENGEPTVHALRQLESIAATLNGWGGQISVCGPTEKSLAFYRTYLKSLENVTFSIGTIGSKVLPVLDFKEADGSLIYHSHGYNTSLGTDLENRIQ